MNITKQLTGSQFQVLIQKGLQIEQTIKINWDEFSLKQKNEHYSKWLRHPFPNPISIGFICLFLIIPLVWGWATTIDFFNLSIPLTAILSVSLMPITGGYIALIIYCLGQGYVIGLRLLQSFYIFNIFITLTGLALVIIKSVEINVWMKQLSFFPFQILTLYLCRYLMNSRSFCNLVSYFHTIRFYKKTQKNSKN